MTFRVIAQLWNSNTPAIISCDADLTENYMYISMKFRTGVHVFCWEVDVFNRSCFQSDSCNFDPLLTYHKDSHEHTDFTLIQDYQYFIQTKIYENQMLIAIHSKLWIKH